MKEPPDQDARQSRTRENVFHVGTASDLLKFTAMAALLAISADAAIAHAMFWGNDPYWTYWVTDTLLMATVFGLGTAWLGMGLVRGALITVVHILLLTTYYWSLSPIGLPGQPEWLDLERTWITGLPVHLAVYYLGYVLALWLWLRRPVHTGPDTSRAIRPTGPLATLALGTGVAVVVVAGLVQALVTGEFPGLTWFIMRIAVSVPVTFAWWALAGRSSGASIAGGCVLAFVLIAYSHFLGPVGLPDSPVRLLAIDPPPAEVHWLPWRLQFLVLLPMTVGVAVAAFLLAGRWRPDPHRVREERHRHRVVLPISALLWLAVVGAWTATQTGPEEHRATVSARGETGSSLRMTVENRNTHRTPLPPHDWVRIEARVQVANGAAYDIIATEPMVAEPLGRFTTWKGVGLDTWHHGRSGIGMAPRAPVNSDVAVFAVGSVTSGGKIIGTGVPVNVFTDPERRSLELLVGDPGVPLPGVDGGQLRASWTEYDGGHDRTLTNARYIWGGSVMLIVLLWAIAAVRADSR